MPPPPLYDSECSMGQDVRFDEVVPLYVSPKIEDSVPLLCATLEGMQTRCTASTWKVHRQILITLLLIQLWQTKNCVLRTHTKQTLLSLAYHWCSRLGFRHMILALDSCIRQQVANVLPCESLDTFRSQSFTTCRTMASVSDKSGFRQCLSMQVCWRGRSVGVGVTG